MYIHLSVTAKSYHDPDQDLHWFGFLDTDPHGNQSGSTKLIKSLRLLPLFPCFRRDDPRDAYRVQMKPSGSFVDGWGRQWNAAWQLIRYGSWLAFI
jgi:hypothetical protein